MKRILILLAMLVVGNVYATWKLSNGIGWEKFDLATYKAGCHQAGCVLVSDIDGRWFFLWNSSNGVYGEAIRARAVAQCQMESKRPSTCQIVDENLESDFVKNFQNPSESVQQASSSTRVTEQECFDEFHREGGRLWKNFVEWENHMWLSPSDCDAYVSEDRLTWIGSVSEKVEGEQSVEENQVATIPEATKTIDPPEPQSPEAVASQPTEADKNIELEFWQSIKDSNNRNMFREYLRQFPSGVYAGLAKIKLQELSADQKTQAASIPNLDYGDYYALVIGNNEYQDLTNLRSAVNDAKVVSTVLEVDYGFNVKLLENASRKEILRSLKDLRQSVSAKDNVLIYYAGHGYLDKDTDYGYWLPVDSERDDDSNWIPTDRVVSQVKGMKAKHVMVVADSCFSGTITRGLKITERTPEWLSQIVKKKARTALTSGGLEPVLDTGSGNHSAFAYAFISLLEENDGVLDASQLFSQLRPKVMINSDQTPEYGNIHQAGHDGGDFLFVRR